MRDAIKKHFETPKKAACTIALAVAALAFVGAGTAFAASTVAESSAIGETAAQNYAFADAGVDPTTAENIITEFDFEAGQFVYEVEFLADGTEYEYWIAADDGAVVKREAEIVSLATDNASDVDAKITLDEAKEIALADAGLTADEVTFTKAELDQDNEGDVYDVEFYNDSTEYEYEILVATGDIYSKSKEITAATNDTVDATTTTDTTSEDSTATEDAGGAVTLAKAKELALADAGLTADEVTFTKAETDYDNGVKEYDIEFYTNDAEYEYEVRASDGTILDKSVEAFETTTTSTSGDYITLDKAKSIALNKVGLAASDVTFTKAKLEKDDGVMQYEIEFYKGTTEYEFEINATTGTILDYDIDYD